MLTGQPLVGCLRKTLRWLCVATAFGAALQAQDLTISKTHVGNFFQGQTGATYTVTVSNLAGTASLGTTTVTDTIPAGLTLTGLNGGASWACTVATATCTSTLSVAPGNNYPAITVTVNVAANAPPSVTNTATLSGGGDTTPGNNVANDPTTII